MNVRFIPVKLGHRHLMIDENQMPGFCAAAREKTPPAEEYVHGDDYVKRLSSEAAPGKDELVIPQRFGDFYEKGLIVAKVIRINTDGTVMLDKGSTNRLRPGLLMAVTGWARINLEVVSVSERESVARPFYFWNSDRRVRVGDELTTGKEWQRPRGTGFRRLSSPPVRGKQR
jgi:hypothetical protein